MWEDEEELVAEAVRGAGGAGGGEGTIFGEGGGCGEWGFVWGW